MKRTTLMVAAAAAAALLLAGCTAGPAPSSEDQTSEIDLSVYEAAATEAMAPVTEWPGPVDGPAAQTGAKVMWLACGLAAEGCSGPAEAAQQAADALGWELRVADGQFDPKNYNRFIQEAIDQDYDAVVLNSISADAVAEVVKRAREAGVIVGSWDGGNEPSDTGVSFEVDRPVAQQGVDLANYLIWKTKGKTNAYLTEAPEFHIVMEWVTAAKETFEACETCTVVRADQFTAAEGATRVPSMMVSALRANPEINAVVGAYDASLLAAIPAIQQAGFTEAQIGGFNAIEPMLQFIRDGKAAASSGQPNRWAAWAAFDNVNRILAGEQPVAQNLPTRLITSENIDEFPEGTGWEGDIDYAAEYLKIWNGK